MKGNFVKVKVGDYLDRVPGTAADEATAAIAVVAAMAGTRIASADAAAAKIDPETPGHKIASLLTASVNGTGKAGKAIVDTFRTPKG